MASFWGILVGENTVFFRLQKTCVLRWSKKINFSWNFFKISEILIFTVSILRGLFLVWPRYVATLYCGQENVEKIRIYLFKTKLSNLIIIKKNVQFFEIILISILKTGFWSKLGQIWGKINSDSECQEKIAGN